MGLFDKIRSMQRRMYVYGIPIRTHTETSIYSIVDKCENKNCVTIIVRPPSVNNKTTIGSMVHTHEMKYILN